MPYYVFKYENSPMANLRQFELIADFDVFREASKFAKAERNKFAEDESTVIKIMFGDNVVDAEEKLREKREPIPGDD